MESNNSEMCKSLKEWFKTLNVHQVKASNNDLDLSDGVAMGKALHKFSPDFFSGTINLSYSYFFIKGMKKMITNLKIMI